MSYPSQGLYSWICRSKNPALVHFLSQNPKVAHWLDSADAEEIRSIRLEQGTLIIDCLEPTAQFCLQRCDELLEQTGLYLALITRLAGKEWLYDTNLPLTANFRRQLEVSTNVAFNMINTMSGLPIPYRGDNTIATQINAGDLIDQCTVSIHREDQGYTYEYIQPLLGIEKILSKPIIELLDRPASEATGVIGEKRVAVIERAIRSGNTEIEPYSYFWEGRFWRKVMIANLLPGLGRIQVKTMAAQSERQKQLKFWEDWLFKGC